MLQQASVRWLADRANGWYIYHASIRHSSRQMYFFCFLLRCPPSTNIFDYLYEYGSSWVHVGPWTLWAPWAHGPMGPMGSMGLCDKAQGPGPGPGPFAFGVRPQQKHVLAKTDMSHMWRLCHFVDFCPNKQTHTCVSESFGGWRTCS